ncbi:metallophosphoesterase family protein [Rhizobium grahamii]|uniref:Metallophosphoesterase family protein n=1 Tax=Rhizobium grahamii TaxID=1120045 RepID=A0A5Q0C4Q9_9HYPH|nr:MULTISPECIES: metallophosphoesterase family protein [Rhizobium]QFY60876.1 metallophosphoesterase family protein [Rhizobium grahamii]QRM49977.1 metallophosphoesterase family protein [Rhizobium sp. BG6]
MRFAAIADVHGNHLALEAVLADIAAQGVTDIVNLGDCFSGPLTAGRTAEVLRARDMLTVRGNHDRYLIDRPRETMHASDAAAFDQLTADDLHWLRGLPTSAVYRDEVYLCHATPADDNTYWLESVSADGHVFLKPLAEIEALAVGADFSLVLCGHSHIPRMVRLSDSRLIVNPGSVGCPAYDDDLPYYHKVETGHPMASYCILEKGEGGWLPEFRTVAYDHMAMSRLAKENARPEWAGALATGWLP